MSNYGVTDAVGFLLLESDEEFRTYLVDNYTLGIIMKIIEWSEGEEPTLKIQNDHGEWETWSRH